ncbi:MAG: MFS transporter [Negativicutes bacterium]|nr:MFS transporter [Negativicutes bacterium]MDR3589942.1 MFS transporter [Negativicutes bacterium]
MDKIKNMAGWGVVFGIFAATVVCFMDRVNISVAAPMMIKEYGWDSKSLGYVFSAFFWGYFLCQLPVGWLADKFGPRNVLGYSIGGWGLFSILTAFPSNLFALMAVRAGLGIAEAPSMPATASFVARHLPRRMVGRIQALNLSAIAVGPLVATPFAAFLIAHYDWRSVFYACAVISFVFLGYWMYITKKANMTDAVFHSQKEAEATEKNVVPAVFEKPLKQIEVWGSSMQAACNSYVFTFLVLWLPTYFVVGRGMSVQEMAIFGTIPWAVLFVMMNVAGYFVDWVKNNTTHNIFWRRMILVAGYFWCAACIIMIQNVETSNQALMYICAALVGLAFTWPVGFSLPIEYAGLNAGFITGFMNCFGQFASIIQPLITGYVASTNDWGRAFWWAAVFALAGAVAVLITSKYNTGVKNETTAPKALAN